MSETKKISVSCQNITKTYSSNGNIVNALRGASLEVEEGELLMLAGPSGCGKTTLISIIASILDYDEGNCQVLGKNIQDLDPSTKINFRAQNIGFVFQAFNLIPSLTASENIAVPLIIQGMPKKIAAKYGAEMLEQMGMGEKKESFPSSLSGGQQQRVAIGRALIHNPKLVVCDEPTSALDSETGQKIMKIMKRIAKEEKRTLIVVTHDIRIYPFADRIAMMEDGQILKIFNSYKDAIEHHDIQEGQNV